MNFNWTDLPKTDDPVLRLIRNFCSEEFDGSRVYPEGPTFEEWEVGTTLRWLKENGTADQYDEIESMYHEKLEVEELIPFACTLNDYCKKHDSIWHQNNRAKNYKLVQNNVK